MAAMSSGAPTRLRHRGLDAPRADGVHADAGAGQVVRGGLRQADHARLRRRIGDTPRIRPQARHRGRQHDGTAALALHVRHRLPDGEERTHQVHAQHLGPVRDRLLDDARTAGGDAGIGEDHVHAAPGLDAAADEGPHGVLLAGIGGNRDGLAAPGRDLPRDGLGVGGGTIHADDPRTFLREAQRAGAADAVAGAGDHGALASQACCHGCLPLPPGGMLVSTDRSVKRRGTGFPASPGTDA
jgi:hypothetical protein